MNTIGHNNVSIPHTYNIYLYTVPVAQVYKIIYRYTGVTIIISTDISFGVWRFFPRKWSSHTWTTLIPRGGRPSDDGLSQERPFPGKAI